MAQLRPFRGLRPPKELVSLLAVPPYDVVSRTEAAQLAKGNERSFFHISRAEIAEAFRGVERLSIADGHHRSAAASRVRRLRRERGAGECGHDHFLAVVFPHDQLKIVRAEAPQRPGAASVRLKM